MSHLNTSELELGFGVNLAEHDVTLISQDTYNERKIFAKVKSKNVIDLFACALQYCLVGCGKNSHGNVIVNGVKRSVRTICLDNDVKLNVKPDERLSEDDLTLRRLARLFRFEICKFIKRTKIQSFLYKKYCSEGEAEYVFPCSEYLVNSSNKHGLIKAYEELDKQKGTVFSKRVEQVLKARKVL